jgi:CobQ-like glutamine amidotransferase family enzyme
VPDTLRVCALYPDLMNIYADRGNLLLLERRCEWRGLGFELHASGLGDRLDPDGADLYYIGGGQDRDQKLCALDLAEVKREALHAAAERGAVILAVCGGYQLLGHSYQLGEDSLPGAGAKPLGRVVKGHGNNGADGYEGVRERGVIGTYLHGPLLPKNAWFADWLISTALDLDAPLAPLEDSLEQAAHADARHAAGV